MHEVVGDGRCEDFEAAEGGGGGQSCTGGADARIISSGIGAAALRCEEVRAEKARGEARARSIAEVLAARALADAQLVADAEERASGG